MVRCNAVVFTVAGLVNLTPLSSGFVEASLDLSYTLKQHDEDPLCVSPGTCTPPSSLYVRGRDAVPRYQWTGSGGFCGASSIQTIIQSFGAYFSQDIIRKVAPKADGHGNRIQGYEILHTNIEPALTSLGITYTSWNWESEPQPQGYNYLSWLKSQLAQNNGVVQFVLCQGDAHEAYAEGNVYDHIEPFFKLYTNHAVNDSTIYGDDVVAHGSGYSPDLSLIHI